jgi:uncharacterized membrane protein
MDVKTQRTLLAASVAGILAAVGVAATGSRAQAAEEAEQVHCYGINKCKGTGACGGAGHSCAGENACKGQGFLDVEQDTCLKIEGGRLTADAPQP